MPMPAPAHATSATLALRTGAAIALVLAWDASGLDLPLARLSGGPAGFALHGHWLLTRVLHDGAKSAAWLLVLALCIGIWWPWAWLQRLPTDRRIQLATGTLLAVFSVSTLKSLSTVSCPWDLAGFGGVVGYSSHWSHLFRPDGGSGQCFPAGHASSGFAFVGGYFAFRDVWPGLARRWLAVAMATGLLLGLAQQLRGAHFMSHTLWTGLVCWCVCWAVDAVRRHLRTHPTSTVTGSTS
ncbi:MAG: phosphatase PAP2 family protein [Haliea sp.]|nr:MAG: phosphatase PAP2 family protein [Haliea sp.]